MTSTQRHEEILNNTFRETVEKKVFIISVYNVICISAAIIGVAAGIGYFFNSIVTFGLVGLLACLGILIWYGPAIDEVVKNETDILLENIAETFKMIPKDKQENALKLIQSFNDKTLNKLVQVNNLNEVIIRFPVSTNE